VGENDRLTDSLAVRGPSRQGEARGGESLQSIIRLGDSCLPIPVKCSQTGLEVCQSLLGNSLLLRLLCALRRIKGDRASNFLSQHITKLRTVATPYLLDAVHESFGSDTAGAVKPGHSLNKYLALLVTLRALREPCCKLLSSGRAIKLTGQQRIDELSACPKLSEKTHGGLVA